MHSSIVQTHRNSPALIFAPAELEWFRRAPTPKSAPLLLAIEDIRRPGSERLWWRELLQEFCDDFE